MKLTRTLVALALFLAFSLPAVAQDAAADAGDQGVDDAAQPAEEQTILGRWEVRSMVENGRAEQVPDGAAFVLVFDENGHCTVYEGGQVEETYLYEHNPEAARIEIYEVHGENKDHEVTLEYSFDGEILVLDFNEGGDNGQMRLARAGEGADAQQPGGGAAPGRNNRQSLTQMRGIHQGGVTYAMGHREKMPDNLGQLVVGDYLTPGYLLAPGSGVTVPEGFDDWNDQRKIDWAIANTSYALLDAGFPIDLDSRRVSLLELPAGADAETVNLLFADNHVEQMNYEDADELIRAQTGHSIERWMRTTTPGSGVMTLPVEGEEAGAAE